ATRYCTPRARHRLPTAGVEQAEVWVVAEATRSALAGDLAYETKAFKSPNQLVGRREGHVKVRADEVDVDDWGGKQQRQQLERVRSKVALENLRSVLLT